MAGVISGCQIFPNDNVWNADIRTLAVHASSATYIASIGGASAGITTGAWGDGVDGFPINVVANGTMYPINLGAYAVDSDPGPYPVPPTANVEPGSDKHCLVVDVGRQKLYELFNAVKQLDNSWDCDSGVIWDLTSNALHTDGNLTADAAGLPMTPGIIRYDEIADGAICHALRIIVPATCSLYLWPARHVGGSGTTQPPMGARLRLKASVDISGYSTTNQIILRCLQRYGAFVADNGGGSNYIQLCGAPDVRFNDTDLGNLSAITANNFEVVDESSLMLNANLASVPAQSGVDIGRSGIWPLAR